MNTKKLVPRVFKEWYWRRYAAPDKHDAELSYWRKKWEEERHSWDNNYYKQRMLDIAGEKSPDFLAGKIVADFGCGPRGSLWWADSAAQRIGIDVLADAYGEFNIKNQNMTYVCSSEAWIPLPSSYVDVLFTVNALDHVENLEVMSNELLRILAPGGELIASFNLGEPPTPTEPQSLDEEIIDRVLLSKLERKTYRVAARGSKNPYEHFFDGSPAPSSGVRYLWVRAKKIC